MLLSPVQSQSCYKIIESFNRLKGMKNKKYFYLTVALTLTIFSCTSLPKEPVTSESPPPISEDEARQQGVANKFEKLYSQLVTRDLDEMNDLVLQKIREYRKAPEEEGLEKKLTPLKSGVWLVMARPNEDNMVEKVLPLLKPPLDELDAWESTFHSIVDESISALKNTQNVSASDQVTYTVVLENIIAELKPEGQRKSDFEYKLIEKIAKAGIEVTKECRHERKIRMMKSTTSPSRIAQKIIEEIQGSQKK